MSSSTGAGRALVGAALLDLAVSPLFIWDTFTASLSREIHASAAALSVVFAVGLAAFTTGVLVGGRMADVVAPRRLALIAGVCVVAGLETAALAPGLFLLIAGFGVVLGVGTGVGYATAVRVAGTVTSGRGQAVGIVVSAYAAGAVALAPIASFLLGFLGLGGTFAVLGGGLGLLLMIAAALLSGASPTSSRKPTAERGVDPTGIVPALWAMFLLGCAPALIAFAHAGEFAGGRGTTVVAVAMLNTGNFVGRLIAGPASDRVGRAPALHATQAVLAAACVALTLSNRLLVLLAALLALGTQYGALSVLTPTVTADSVPAERFGATYGRVFSGWGVAGLTGPVAAVWLASYTGYHTVAGALVAVAVLAWLATAWTLKALQRSKPS